jgi:hypothetical protein
VNDDFPRLIEPLARLFFGEPNSRMSSKTELRFGKHGSLSIDLKKGTWYDHEQQIGGGAIDLVKQQRGFSETRDAVAWLEAEGYLNGKHEPKANGDGRRLGTEVAHYDYVDEAGNLVLQVVRFEPKDFRQRRPDGRGGWQWSIAGVRAVPYRLPELLDALAQDYLIFVVEGEKDADNLRKIGAHATTNAMGAGKWRSALNQYFIGADVVIIADNDPQQTDKACKLQFHPDGRPRHAGQDHAQAVAAELVEVAARVRVLDLGKMWPQCPAKGDISDWIAAGGSIELLYDIVDRLPTWSPDAPRDVPLVPLIAPFPIDDTTIPRRQWIIPGLLLRRISACSSRRPVSAKASSLCKSAWPRPPVSRGRAGSQGAGRASFSSTARMTKTKCADGSSPRSASWRSIGKSCAGCTSLSSPRRSSSPRPTRERRRSCERRWSRRSSPLCSPTRSMFSSAILSPRPSRATRIRTAN